MAADEKALGALHTQVAVALSKALEGQTIKAEEGTDEEDIFIPPSAAILQAAAKFLKDNNVTCVAAKDNALGELEKKMAERAERRNVGKFDKQAATDQMGFLKGLN